MSRPSLAAEIGLERQFWVVSLMIRVFESRFFCPGLGCDIAIMAKFLAKGWWADRRE